ncbi:hypothetical protein ST47_g2589 [Ascochyta rabiei]|uniref:Uncharacterized protein n=1 Tax=Didymella rabiei TaxID=5454 RepID=A0A163JH65_DIDRA|nr:hypothetical protein ST47_g2589 [Ascochyta rabiei]
MTARGGAGGGVDATTIRVLDAHGREWYEFSQQRQVMLTASSARTKTALISSSSFISDETSASTCAAPGWPRMFERTWGGRLESTEMVCVKRARLSGSGSESKQEQRPALCHRTQVAGGSGTMAVVGRHGFGFSRRMEDWTGLDAPGAPWSCVAGPVSLSLRY